jgi:hypothetical protein
MTVLLPEKKACPAGSSLAKVRQSREGKSSESGLASNSTSTSSSRKAKKAAAPSKPLPYKSLAAKPSALGNGKAGSSGSNGAGAALPARFQRYISGGRSASSSAQNGAAKSANGLHSAQNCSGRSGKKDSNSKIMLPDSDEAARSRDSVGNISACASRSSGSKQSRRSARRGLDLRQRVYRARVQGPSVPLSAARQNGGALMLR